MNKRVIITRMENKIKNFEDNLKLLMNCKCYAMLADSTSKCINNCGCDGSCSLFKQVITQYINDLKKI